MKSIKALLVTLFLCATPVADAFVGTTGNDPSTKAAIALHMSDNNNAPNKLGNVFNDIKGMFNNFDDVVDDFLFKRMGAGEQWYGKRKYNPSGKFDGDYNGMGRSDCMRIEIARVQKEEMELRRQRRLLEEQKRKEP